MRRSYLRDYGGPNVLWPGDVAEPDWAAMHPIPEARRVDDRPAKRRRLAQKTEDEQPDDFADMCGEVDDDDDDDDDDDGFWLSPRMACRLHSAGIIYVDIACEDEIGITVSEMPPVVQPYAEHKPWMAAYRQAAMRLVKRLEKGMTPAPNCTAEEFALHMIIDMAKSNAQDGAFAEAAGPLNELPYSTLDEDFDLVSDVAFQDHDVLMLFDMPELIQPNGLTQMMDFANLHPKDWFKPFQPRLASNHV